MKSLNRMMAEFGRGKDRQKRKSRNIARIVETGMPVAAGLAVGGAVRGEMVRSQMPKLWVMNEFVKSERGKRLFRQNKDAFQKTMNKIIGPSPNKVAIAAGLGTTAALAGGIALEKRLRERQRRKQMLLR